MILLDILDIQNEVKYRRREILVFPVLVIVQIGLSRSHSVANSEISLLSLGISQKENNVTLKIDQKRKKAKRSSEGYPMLLFISLYRIEHAYTQIIII